MPPTSPYDVTIAIPEEGVELKFMAYRTEDRVGGRRAPPLRTEPQPLREGEQFYRQEQRATYNDGSGGAGYGERVAENVYHHGLPADARQPGLILPPGLLTEMDMSAVPMAGPPYAFLDAYVAGAYHTYGVGPRYLFSMANGTGTPAIARDLGASFTGYSMVNHYGNVFIGGVGGPIWKIDATTGGGTQSADVYRQYLETVYWVRAGQGSAKIVGSTAPGGAYSWADRSIMYTDNPDPMTEAVWSDEIFVGDTGHSITRLVASNQVVYVLKANGVYKVDDRLYSPNITAYRKHVGDILNPMAGWISNGHLYFGSRTGLDRVPLAQDAIRQDRPQRCEFGFNTPNYGPIRGIPMAGINGDGGSYVAYWNATSATTYLCWQADWRDVEGIAAPRRRGPMLHHGALAVLPGVQVLSMHLSTASGDPRLWLGGYRSATNRGTVHWLSLPRAGSPYQDLLQGGPMRFATDMIVDWPRENHGSDVSRKDLTRVSIRGDNLGTAVLSASATFEGEVPWIDTPTSLGSVTSAYEEFQIEDPTNVRDMTFRVTGTGSSTVPPIFRALEGQAGVSVEANTVHTYVLVAGTDVRLANGKADSRDMFRFETDIEAIRGRRGTLTDHRRRRAYDGRVLQDVSLIWEELPSGERTGRIVVTIPFLAHNSGWRLDSGRFLDSGLRIG